MEEIVEPKIYTVTEITKGIKRNLETAPELNQIWVTGEIYNLTYHSSGHIYFTLKDDNAVISAVFFKFANKKLTFRLEEGMNILAFGSVTVFEKRGSYQLNVQLAKPEGIGELQKRIDQLKNKLAEEGMFDEGAKKEIPFLPRRIGIVTSPTGAAIRDIIKVALRRYPTIEILLAPAKVQGDGAAESIVRGIEELNREEWNIDVIIAGRGGGSFEDLYAFNEEVVVRAFHASRVPVISAVGHQVDHPLSDDAADLAAPTPSAAAEMVVPVKQELADEIDYIYMRSRNSLTAMVKELRARVEGVTARRIFRDPREIIYSREVVLGDTEHRIVSAMKDMVSSRKSELLTIPDIRLLMKNILKNKSHGYDMALGALERLSPLGVMKRGYSITLNKDNAVVKSVTDVKKGERVTVRHIDGSLACAVEEITGEGLPGGRD